MRRQYKAENRVERKGSWRLLFAALSWILVLTGCAQEKVAKREEAAPSAIVVTAKPGEPLVIKTPVAEFDVFPWGDLQAYLLKDGKRLTLDEPKREREAGADYVVAGGKEIRDFDFDLDHAKVSVPQGRLGSRGKRIEIRGRPSEAGGLSLAKTLTLEVYDDFPNLALTTVAYKNTGSEDLKIGASVTQSHLLNASLADPQVLPYDLWSFQGSSYEWGKDEVVHLSKNFSRPNVMGAISPSGAGGGIPVVAFWTGAVGVAIGHLETLPLAISMPVKVDKDGRIAVGLSIETAATLKPKEAYTTPASFVAVYPGDYYDALSVYSRAMQRQGWKVARPTNDDFSANWCGWGYRSDVTPAQMLGTIPKLKELNFRWATLDYRWFNNFGDWEPRPETFPGDALKRVLGEFHKQGIKVQLWWVPLAVSDGQVWEPIGPEERTPGAREQQKRPAEIVKEHPDWLILDKNGKPARLFLNRAAFCPALPAVRDYYRKLTEKFIRDWDFDGHKLDMCFTVPPCYNPQHHHKSPQESMQAMGEVFKVIFETTRRLKPESVTQICPCGTTPNFAWLPYLDQAVTADPVGAVQVRRRIKMYKALLGPQAAVYGDHVELSAMQRVGREYVESGADFASTVGTGGVLGTKFTWPDYGPTFKNVFLTPAKEAHWKKWIDLYNSKMLSQGTFLNLYTLGYDVPEGYAIAKDGKMYYAFFAPEPAKPWKGEVELRGLQTGRYRVFDYEKGRELGAIDGAQPRLATEFTHHLLLEVSNL
jgi:alpha-galactosidase